MSSVSIEQKPVPIQLAVSVSNICRRVTPKLKKAWKLTGKILKLVQNGKFLLNVFQCLMVEPEKSTYAMLFLWLTWIRPATHRVGTPDTTYPSETPLINNQNMSQTMAGPTGPQNCGQNFYVWTGTLWSVLVRQKRFHQCGNTHWKLQWKQGHTTSACTLQADDDLRNSPRSNLTHKSDQV